MARGEILRSSNCSSRCETSDVLRVYVVLFLLFYLPVASLQLTVFFAGDALVRA